VRWLVLICLPVSSLAAGEEALIAVATNFLNTARILEAEFERSGEHRVTLTSGATGKLYSQIRNGAPYDVLLSADQARPEMLEKSGLGVSGSRFTYASGRLVAWSSDPARIMATPVETLNQGNIRALAIANPRLAPYGQAAMEVLASLQVLEPLESRLVLGENVGQAYALVATANAELGLVSLSQVTGLENAGERRYVEIDPVHHQPIRQDAILLKHGARNAAAIAFLVFLRGEAATGIIVNDGYERSDGG
jgi:molybdate transport system substrate-binding protein